MSHLKDVKQEPSDKFADRSHWEQFGEKDVGGGGVLKRQQETGGDERKRKI